MQYLHVCTSHELKYCSVNVSSQTIKSLITPWYLNAWCGFHISPVLLPRMRKCGCSCWGVGGQRWIQLSWQPLLGSYRREGVGRLDGWEGGGVGWGVLINLSRNFSTWQRCGCYDSPFNITAPVWKKKKRREHLCHSAFRCAQPSHWLLCGCIHAVTSEREAISAAVICTLIGRCVASLVVFQQGQEFLRVVLIAPAVPKLLLLFHLNCSGVKLFKLLCVNMITFLFVLLIAYNNWAFTAIRLNLNPHPTMLLYVLWHFYNEVTTLLSSL